jgi:hypothetical protein
MNKVAWAKLGARSAVVAVIGIVALALIDGLFGTNSLETALEGLGLANEGGGE